MNWYVNSREYSRQRSGKSDKIEENILYDTKKLAVSHLTGAEWSVLKSAHENEIKAVDIMRKSI